MKFSRAGGGEFAAVEGQSGEFPFKGKNTAQLSTLFALANLVIAKKALLAGGRA